MIAVVVVVVASSVSTVVMVARATIVVVVNTLGPTSGLDGVPCISVGPKTTLDR
jgi:hypothetical protein